MLALVTYNRCKNASFCGHVVNAGPGSRGFGTAAEYNQPGFDPAASRGNAGAGDGPAR